MSEEVRELSGKELDEVELYFTPKEGDMVFAQGGKSKMEHVAIKLTDIAQKFVKQIEAAGIDKYEFTIEGEVYFGLPHVSHIKFNTALKIIGEK